MDHRIPLQLIISILSLPAFLAGCSSSTSTPFAQVTAHTQIPTGNGALLPVVYTVPDMEKVYVRKDLVYDTADPFKKMDLYHPDLRGVKYPAVILVHGEVRARENSKEQAAYVSWGQLIAASGMIAVMFNWDWPQSTNDIDHLVQHVRTSAGTLGIDKDRLCIFAFSGGVPYGVATALRGTPGYVRCIVAYYGSLDLALTQLRSEPAQRVAPILIVMAANDDVVSEDENDPFVHYATSQGVKVEVLIHPSGVHSFDTLNDDEQSREIIKKTVEFLQAHLDVH